MNNKYSVLWNIWIILTVISIWLLWFGIMYMLDTPSEDIVKMKQYIEDNQKEKVIEKDTRVSWLVQYLIVDNKTSDILWYEEYIFVEPTKLDLEQHLANGDLLISELSTHYLTYWTSNLEWKKIQIYNIKFYEYNLETSDNVFNKELLNVLDLKYNEHQLCFQNMKGEIKKDTEVICNPAEEDSLMWYFATSKVFCYQPINCQYLEIQKLNKKRDEIVDKLWCKEDLNTQCQLTLWFCGWRDYPEDTKYIDELECLNTEFDLIQNKAELFLKNNK